MKKKLYLILLLSAALLTAGIVLCCRKTGSDEIGFHTEKTTAESISTPAFSRFAAENDKGESVFSISLENFTDYYNSVYRQRHKTDYLNPTDSDNWYYYTELSPCFGYESARYQFTADKTVWPMPTISVYAPNNEEIYEIRMTFDDHGYQERFHVLFRELCICMEKTLMPEMSETEAETLFEVLYAQAYTNFFGNHHAYGDLERPPLYSVYKYGKIGMYCFYGAGDIEICFIPLTEAALDKLKTEDCIVVELAEE